MKIFIGVCICMVLLMLAIAFAMASVFAVEHGGTADAVLGSAVACILCIYATIWVYSHD